MPEPPMDAVEDWFRREGVPTFVTTPAREHSPLRKALAVLVVMDAFLLWTAAVWGLLSLVAATGTVIPLTVLVLRRLRWEAHCAVNGPI